MPLRGATCVQMNLTEGPCSWVCGGVGKLSRAEQCDTLFWLCSGLAVHEASDGLSVGPSSHPTEGQTPQC